MSLIVAGIDEAGYGPLLGPLCVGMAVLRLDDWSVGDRAPDFWEVLGSAVCRDPNDARQRVAVNDSKRLKLPNNSSKRHPLVHLERGVLSFLPGQVPKTVGSFFEAVGASSEPHPWYAPGTDESLPLACAAHDLKFSRNALSLGLQRAGASVAAIRCEVIGEQQFNSIIASRKNKGATTAHAIASLLKFVWDDASLQTVEGGPRIVCDRQGGRRSYKGLLVNSLRDSSDSLEVEVVEETAGRSRYVVRGEVGGDQRQLTVMFTTEAESKHLSVALASMCAKLVRELCMRRFNEYWCGAIPELKPTAGYRNDARRWLEDGGTKIDSAARAIMVRKS